MEGGDQEHKHTCKVCGRSFLCGRSLGGHMRSHASMTSSSSEAEEKPPLLPALAPPPPSQSNRGFLGFGGGGVGYDLRENPKKTWRLSDYDGAEVSSPKRDQLCRECGKGFPSWRALFGHMRCHPDRSSHTLEQEHEEQEEEEEEGSWSSGGAHMEVLYSQSVDEEASAAAVTVPRRRSMEEEIEIERELEDGALCLMMLSRDVGSCGGIHAIAESSDKNSVVLEEEEEEGEGSEKGVIRFRYPRNGPKKVESDVSDDEFKKPKWEDFDWELSKASSKKSRPRRAGAELGKGKGLDQGDSGFGKYTPTKRSRFDACNAKLRRASCDGSLGKPPHKKSQYECTTCNKIFHSYQALGGHRASHKRIRGCCASKTDGSRNGIETEISIDAIAAEEMVGKEVGVVARCESSPKKAGRHECPICLMVFPSSRAMCGHKRSHSVVNSDAGGVDAACHQTVVIQQQLPATSDLLDLNLPASGNKDSNITNGQVGFKSWWVGSNHKRETLVRPISN